MGHNLKKAASGDGKHVRAMGVEAAQKGTAVLSSLKLWPAVAKAFGQSGQACQPGYFQRLTDSHSAEIPCKT